MRVLSTPESGARVFRTRAIVAVYAMVVLTAVAASVALTRPDNNEAVLNPSAARDLSHWEAASDERQLRLSRVTLEDGPNGIGTAVEVERSGDGGRWSYAFAHLREPASFLEAGVTYRMRLFVRDSRASAESIGLALADIHYEDEPAALTQYGRFGDRGWHLLQRTFTATEGGTSDLGLYVDLPDRGPLSVQLTGASLRQETLPRPPATSDGPSEVVTFDGDPGSPPDPASWVHETGGHGWGNDELQTNTASTSNARLDADGLLLIVRRERTTGPDGITRSWSSTRLRSRFEVPPGSYVEAVIRAPTGSGLRPAFWTLGTDLEDVGWPASGELDVMEGSSGDPSLVRHSVHMPSLSHPDVDRPYGEHQETGSTTLLRPRDAGWHRYGVYFDDSVVAFYVDRVRRLTLTRQEAWETDRAWPFDRPQRLLLGVAVLEPPPPDAMPAVMYVSEIAWWKGGVPPAE